MLAGEPGVWPVGRLTDEDQRMLWPDEIWPQEIGALAVLDGGLAGPGGRVRAEAVGEVIAARLRLVPRFRQLLYVPRPGLGRPLSVDAPAFDLADHVRVVPVPAPGDEAALLRAAEQLRRVRLDRSRPLWQMWLLPGLPEGRVWRRAFPDARRLKESHACHRHRIRARRIDRRGHHLHGARFLLAPSTAAAGFGIAAWHDGGKADPYLSVKGVRDIASGLIAVILLAARMPHVLGWFELAASTIPIGDAIIVLRSNGPKATVYGVHGATAVVLLATAALLFA
jgi:hypothetical protein